MTTIQTEITNKNSNYSPEFALQLHTADTPNAITLAHAA
jgi:hypothetical protein